MDQNNFSPNSQCFSSLIEVMIINNDINGIDDILTHMENNNINPSLRSLRRLAIYYAKNNNEEKVTQVNSIHTIDLFSFSSNLLT